MHLKQQGRYTVSTQSYLIKAHKAPWKNLPSMPSHGLCCCWVNKRLNLTTHLQAYPVESVGGFDCFKHRWICFPDKKRSQSRHCLNNCLQILAFPRCSAENKHTLASLCVAFFSVFSLAAWKDSQCLMGACWSPSGHPWWVAPSR